MVLYNLKVFCSDMKFKMAATAGLSLTLDPMGIKNSNLVKDIPMIILYSLGSVSSLVSEKIFEISANQSILLALAAILNIS
jgi:hypothetical protein